MPICARQSVVERGAVRDCAEMWPVTAGTGRTVARCPAARPVAGLATAAKPATVVATIAAAKSRRAGLVAFTELLGVVGQSTKISQLKMRIRFAQPSATP